MSPTIPTASKKSARVVRLTLALGLSIVASTAVAQQSPEPPSPIPQPSLRIPPPPQPIPPQPASSSQSAAGDPTLTGGAALAAPIPAPFAPSVSPYPNAPIDPTWAPMPIGFLEQPGLFPRTHPVRDPKLPVPIGYRIDAEARRPLWLAGTIIFSSSHALTGLVAGGLLTQEDPIYTCDEFGCSGADDPRDLDAGLLFIPVFGPVIWSGVAHPIENASGREMFAAMSFVSAIQGTGLGLLLGGLLVPRKVYKRNDVAETPALSVSVGASQVAVDVAF